MIYKWLLEEMCCNFLYIPGFEYYDTSIKKLDTFKMHTSLFLASEFSIKLKFYEGQISFKFGKRKLWFRQRGKMYKQVIKSDFLKC